MRKFLSTLIFSVLFLISCESRSPQSTENVFSDSLSAVVGGQEVSDKNTFASHIVAVYDAASKTLCTGSLLENNIVLTAAHCVYDDSDIVIIFSRNVTSSRDTSKPLVIAEVDGYEFSPQWISTGGTGRDRGDIVLLHFTGEIPLGYKPTPFLKDFSLLQNSALFTVAGFGISDVQNGKGTGVLRAAEISVANVHYSDTETLADQSRGQGACRGDSGGPAYLLFSGEYQLWGVTSRGSNDSADDCSQLSIFTNLEKFLPWVAEASTRLSGGAEKTPVSSQ